MKRFMCGIIIGGLLYYGFSMVAARPGNPKQAGRPDPSTQAIVGHFAQIVNGFFNIVQDPHNRENLGENISGMLGNMVGIVVAATTKGFEDASLKERELMICVQEHLDEHTKDMLAATIIKRAHQLNVAA